MKSTIVLIAFIFFVCSCDQETEVLVIDKCSLSFQIVISNGIDDDEPMDIADQIIDVYRSQEEAEQQKNKQFSIITNEQGLATIEGIECDDFFVRINRTGYGSYIEEYSSILETHLTPFYTVEFVEGYFFDEGNELLRKQKHISFKHPFVGQKSRYIFYQYDGPQFIDHSYLEDTLDVQIIDQIGDHSYVVEESKIGDLELYFDWPDDDVVRNIWTFRNDSLLISGIDDDLEGSYVASVKGWFQIEQDGYDFPLGEVEEPVFSFESNDFFSWSFYGSAYIGSLSLFDHEFSNVQLYHNSFSFIDGPYKLRCYTGDDGFVRTVIMDAYGMTITGMDLYLE